MTLLLVVLALGFVGWAVLPITGLESVNRYVTALVALIPYAVPAGIVLTVLTLASRRWLTSLVVAVATVVLIAAVVPRAIPQSSVASQGMGLRVLSVNLLNGEADPNRVVDLVREQRVDVLSLQELTPSMAAGLERAGLARELPNTVLQPDRNALGSGIASRFPLRPLSLMPPTTTRQPSAAIELPGGTDVEFVAVHPVYPVGRGTVQTWARELGSLPDPVTSKTTPRVLAGDFNATLDHASLRALIGRGYVDAAARTGRGLLPTWPGEGTYFPPPVTIDHVLVSGGVGVREYRTFGVAGTDHHAIFADLIIPR